MKEKIEVLPISIQISNIINDIQGMVYNLQSIFPDHNYIKISIPKYFKNIIIDSFYHKCSIDSNKNTFLFGCEVINGFGNKIIVFNEMASPIEQHKYYELNINTNEKSKAKSTKDL